jgi:general secretion pathway protein E/type IV pilus assembly protein PilB
MTHYDRLKRKRLGDVLVDEGLATEEIVIAALQEQQRTGALLSEILLQQRQVGEHDLARAIVEHYQVPYIDLRNYTIHKDLVKEIPPALLSRARVVPLDRYAKQMCFACQEIPAKEVVDELRKIAPGGIYFYVASAIDIKKVLEDHAPAAAKPAAAPARAPAGAKAPAQGKAGPAKAPAAAPTDEDSAWKDLFDAANESILTDIKGRDE